MYLKCATCDAPKSIFNMENWGQTPFNTYCAADAVYPDAWGLRGDSRADAFFALMFRQDEKLNLLPPFALFSCLSVSIVII